jgi:hypothetical protein
VKRSRPGFFWFFFYGRRRRGFPWLMVAVFGAAILLGLTFALPRGADLSTIAGLLFILSIALVALGALAVAVAGSIWPRGKR